ncbi:DUF2325 domain-containing protein [Anaerobranca gottschalkii]|uniref:Dihydroorotate dehydrogenase n=1 Tax=Anaerobranca gottschalkii DSM 13577 TaxID=1120990 RepID=A0A1I0AFE7_9FIRM|nr:DUF2325 domain-containing protein [Anaerobranca gottschalkii]SES92924.1 hypothetical protein SAMN03080614_10217 [Anaerobranca gottschalkii DSM 13577]
MSVLLIGGDRLGKIPENLKKIGYTTIKHISGRKYNNNSLSFVNKYDTVIVFTDYINHNLMFNLKKSVKKEEIKIIYCRRSWCHIKELLDCNNCQGCEQSKMLLL